jgi:hypothetical protein
MRARCLKILEGGLPTGRELGSHAAIHIGGEYVILGINAGSSGVSYTALRDGRTSLTASWPSEMFHVTSSRIPASWRVFDPYGRGASISMMPESWASAGFWEALGNREPWALATFNQEVEIMFEEEGQSPPETLEEAISR